jgi:GH15 family glucan-1,4-alpha-glucosidase
MPLRIEEYALIGDCQTAALVGRDGSIDWLCLPRFDSGACFAALLGSAENGRWLLAPAVAAHDVRRRYREDTLILETDFETEHGAVRVVDFMPPRSLQPDLVRIVRGIRGEVRMRMELVVRFDYGWLVPWVRRRGKGIVAVAGPDLLTLCADVEVGGDGSTTVADFTVRDGQTISFVLGWRPSHTPGSSPIEPGRALADTEQWWREWAGRCSYEGEWRDHVKRSLITLKALTYSPTGAIVASPTTSLPEHMGGLRNWDYRYCWVRDATFTLYALMLNGYREEARAWREWLLRAVAGKASQLQIMYGVAGERRLTELTLDWLPGYNGSRPVRIGNTAADQVQLDVFGEVADALHLARRVGLQTTADGWRVECGLLEHLESRWEGPDEGIWEVRGPRRHFTHSRMMAWVAVDRAVRDAERYGLAAPLERWRALRDRIHEEICRRGFDDGQNAFVQYYGGKELDASLLTMPQVGFLPPTDPRVIGTVAAVERRLLVDGFVHRYTPSEKVDGLPPAEGAFLLCTFWLADAYVLLGRREEAREVFERLLSITNDLGLLPEEWDPAARRFLGNFPQAFSHVGLLNTAHNLTQPRGPAEQRQKD